MSYDTNLTALNLDYALKFRYEGQKYKKIKYLREEAASADR